MPLLPEYDELDATAMAALVAQKKLHPKELVEAAIERIERSNPALNAVIYKMYETARRAASGPLPAGPFAGVPYLVKDMVAHAGTPLSCGSNFLKRAGFVPHQSHEVVRRTERAGLIFVGKTNAPEFGLLPITEPEAYGATHNPWDLSRSPGGSSGGSAAAVASGMVPMAHGNDGGGSIRIPASACGVFGLKPSRGRNPGHAADPPSGVVVEHCLSRSVRDSAGLLDVTQGPMLGDRWWAPPPTESFRASARHDPPPLRIAFATETFFGAAPHPDCVAAVHDAAKLCEDLGHHVEEARPDIDGQRFDDLFLEVWAAMAASFFVLLMDQARRRRAIDIASRVLGERLVLAAITRLAARSPLRAPFEEWTVRTARLGARISHARLIVVMGELQRMSFEMSRFLGRYDTLLTPVLGAPPVKTGAFAGLSLEALRSKVQAYAAYTPICNVAGLPAMSVPLFWNPAGLPIGVQFMGAFARDSMLLSLAGQLERARPWTQAPGVVSR